MPPDVEAQIWQDIEEIAQLVGAHPDEVYDSLLERFHKDAIIPILNAYRRIKADESDDS